MGFAGNLRTLALAEVVQTLNRIKAEGVLRLASQIGKRDIIFAAGEVIGVADRDDADVRLLLRRLALLDIIPMPADGDLQDAVASLAVLVGDGRIPLERLVELQREHAVEAFCDLNTWLSADFLFHESTETEDIGLLVERHRGHNLGMKVNQLLMEATRRLDEWEGLKDRFRETDVVRLKEDSEHQAAKHTTGFPGLVLLPMLDGTRSVSEIVEVTGVTRFSIFATLADLQDDQALEVLSAEQLRVAGSEYADVGDQVTAARVFRHLLAATPDDSHAVEALADCLTGLGDTREAAACQAQLALSHLNTGESESAYAAAALAVDLDPTDPQHRGILVRCLINLGRVEEASQHLDLQAQQFEQVGLLEEARDTWRKVLELQPANDTTRHRIAAIQSQRGGATGDVVVCVECSEVNPRSHESCQKCHAKLKLGCMVCAKTVSVADRICIFCGANPHRNPNEQVSAITAPTTERIINSDQIKPDAKEKGSAFWRGELQKHLEAAREHEAAGRLEQALKNWHEVGRIHSGDHELQKHIRALESVVHDRFVEREIARGHEFRRHRRYGRAVRSYRAAIHGVSEQDQRLPKLRELAAAASHSFRRTMLLYGVAGILVAGTGAMAVKPYFDVRAIESTTTSISARVATLDIAGIQAVSGELDALSQRGERLFGGHRSRARSAVEYAREDVSDAAAKIAEQRLLEAQAAVERRDPAAAENHLQGIEPYVGPLQRLRLMAVRAAAATVATEQRNLQERKAKALETLAAATATEGEGHLGPALGQYRDLVAIDAGEASQQAAVAVARLEPQLAAFDQSLADIAASASSELEPARSAAQRLVASAEQWGRSDVLAKLRADLDARQIAAAQAWRQLESGQTGEAELAAFVGTHGAAAEGALARARLAQVRNAVRQRDAAIERYRQAINQEQYETAWQVALLVHQQFPGQVAVGQVPIPLAVTSEPAGAEVLVGGQVRGVTPCLVTFEPDALQQPVELRAVGFRHEQTTPAELNQWRWAVALQREARWTKRLPAVAHVLMVSADGGIVAATADHAIAFAADGSPRWQQVTSEAIESASAVPLLPATVMADGGYLVPASEALAVLTAAGAVTVRLAVPGGPRGISQLYHNDLLGSDWRVAAIGDRMYSGPVTGPLTALTLPAPPLAGPLAILRAGDRVLLVVDTQCRLHALEEGGGAILWSQDLGATEVSCLTLAGEGLVAGICDGARLEAWKLSDAGAEPAWTCELPGAVTAPLVLTPEGLVVPCATALVFVAADGTARPTLTLPSPATTAPVLNGHRLAIGCANHLVVIEAGKLLWTTPVTAPVTAIAIGERAVAAALADGTLLSYAP